ncbi:efflux RND transporter permease subunit [Rhodothermus marinus]|uniref:Acriflavin resistance protein n=1 Tax=Rhodothermus marinus (strain ATCC 43812 / DSM 4252 / R-10) TaxID=518766 RepID=D0MGZ1_RHOM4|nr:efflux RND transporter permease subunit [Rhodothermus marinus]ACY47776.1 acriflavin resistance protein [Rhodothermus marinus DSM 4252]
MKITDLAIRQRTTVLVLTVLLAVGGLVSYLTIPKESFPSIEIPNIVITTVYPGASPEDIESLITKPIEEELQGITGIDEIRSTSTEGVSTIVVEFMPDQISLDEAFQKVRDKVDIAKAELPEDAEEPIVSEIDLSELPIMTINLAAPYALSRLKEVAEDLSDELEALPDVLEATVVGGLEREVQVNVDRAALQAYNLTFNDVINAIQRENTNLPGGSIDVDRLNYLVRVDGEFEVPEEINNIVIKAPNGKPIYVRDVAEVVFGYKERDSYAYLRVLQREEDGRLVPVHNQSGEPLQVVSLSIRKRSGANILETTEAIRQVLDRFPFPAGTEVVITGDQSEDVRTLVRDLENNIISGLIFVVAVLLFFLGVRTATLVGIAIPLSMFTSFLVFQALGYTLNFVILFSLIIALGMLVDNAIVIVENIYRFREQGYSRFEAARLATAEVGGAVVASTATTVAAFVPMLFWPGIIGEFMSFLPLTLIITLTSSLFVALVINPVLTGYFMRVEGEKAPRPPRRVRVLAAAVILTLGLVLGLANWKTLVVLAVAVPVIYLLHRYIFSPIGNWFIHHGLPGLIQRYRAFLSWMLERDYSVRHALLRNTFALGSFTLGVVLLVLGGGLSALLGGGPAGMVLTVPGTILAVVGLIGIVLHTLETLFLGGWATVRGGLIFGAVVLVITGLMYLSPREVALTTIVELLTLPLLIIVVGLLGALLNRRGRRYLILTDNRARLLNSVLGALFAILAMFAIAPTGVEFFPKTDPNQIQVTLTAPLGTNVETTDRIAREALARIEQLLNEHPEDRANVKNIQVNVGVGGDRMFGGGSSKPEVATITLDLVDYEDRAVSSRETLDRLRRQLQGIPGVTIKIDQDNPGPPTGPPVNIEISGPEFTEIVRITQEIKQRLIEAAATGRIPGLVDITDNLNTGRPELRVRIDRERAGRFGLSTQQIASTVRAAINGIEASQYRTGEDEYDITVRLKEADRRSLESLRNLTILHEGQQIPLAAVADFELGGGLGAITRLDLQRVATVSGDVAPGYNAQAVLQQVRQYLADYERSLPPGYHLAYTGENEEQQESFSFLTTALLIGSALIFLIMIAQFNRVSGPFLIMIAVGLSLIGVLLGLILTRTAFGLMTFIGLISLAGIVVNNNIVLIDYTMQLQRRGLSKHDAIIEAGATRLRPVILTALTTVIGLVPLTFGINIDFVGLLINWEPNFQLGSENTQFWGPMGTAIISGLTFGTFLTLVIMPVLYSSFDSVANHLRRFLGRAPVAAEVGNGATDTPPADVETRPSAVSRR